MLLTADTRERFSETTELNLELKKKMDYVCLTTAAYQVITEDVGLPDGEIDAYQQWLEDNKGKSIILLMVDLYKKINNELKNRKINISDNVIQDWIRENANSINLANNYSNNLDLVVKELTKPDKEEDVVNEEQKNQPKGNTNDTGVVPINNNSGIVPADKVGETLASLTDILSNVNNAATNANSILSQIEGIIHEANDNTTVQDILSNINNAVSNANGNVSETLSSLQNIIRNAKRVSDNLYDASSNIRQPVPEIAGNVPISFDEQIKNKVPVKLISTDYDGHTVEIDGGYRGIIQPHELLPMINGQHYISKTLGAKIYADWKRRKMNEKNNVTLKQLWKTIDPDFHVVSVDPIKPGLWECKVESRTNKEIGASFAVDEGTIYTTDTKIEIKAANVVGEKLKTYYIPVKEKDFLNNICRNNYGAEYLDKLNLIPHEEQIGHLVNIMSMKPDMFHKIVKIILASEDAMKLIKDEIALLPAFKFTLHPDSNVKEVILENTTYVIRIENGKTTITNKVEAKK